VGSRADRGLRRDLRPRSGQRTAKPEGNCLGQVFSDITYYLLIYNKQRPCQKSDNKKNCHKLRFSLKLQNITNLFRIVLA